MTGVMIALGRAFASLMHPKLLVIAILPTLAAVVLWGSLTLAFWSVLNAWVADWLKNTTAVDWMLYAARVAFHWDVATLIPDLARLLILVTVLPLIQVSALMIAAVFAMPMLVRHVASRSYSGLEYRRGGTFFVSVANAVFGATVFLFLWIVALPLWLIPGMAMVLPLALAAYLNQRLFCYDAVSDHADREELRTLLHGYRVGRYSLGAVLGVVHYIPVIGWFAPIYVGLAFIHWGLARLAALRAAPINTTGK